MHSDFWVDVPNSQCPSYVQHNRQVCSRMDAFYAAERANKDALLAWVESMYAGQPITAPAAVSMPATIDDAEMEYLMHEEIKDAAKVESILRGAADADAVIMCLASWTEQLRRATDYLAYNRKALDKRYRKGSVQQEIDRVKKLISDGEQGIELLRPRIEWAEAWIRTRAAQ
jgi:hypothetical protein